VKYMLMMSGRATDLTEVADWTPEDFARHIRFMKDLNAELSANGELVEAQGLAMPDQAVIVTVTADGAPVVTEGPFAESKEFLIGYWIIECDSAQRAHQIAATISGAPGPGNRPLPVPVEVRQVMGISPPVDAY
jgi:hypothetical protein